ncbi:hypothetical protein [Aequorivita echinoideorum]|uniref:Outer membrane protein beta-barrel domain-containing protein n=1 Tax=Aequorivita echinoideorum TaxID=1549647 RepID=A0ABS5S4P0_9FLAO|nr:hypothetical protein [Aequorivita echinoideorum]MBT0608192.1 hypothetical protein [Aequorivita echinoideorum]
MKRILLTTALLLISILGFAQTFEFGPLLQYHRTAFTFEDDSKIVVSNNSIDNGSTTTETSPHVAFGGYAAYYTENTFSYAADLFYVSTSSPNYGDNVFHSINLIPTVGAELGNSNIHFNLGIGAGFILNEPSFENLKDVEPINYKSIDGIIKLALQYRIKKVLSIDGGVLYGINTIVDEQRRFHFYLGARVPVNLFFE